MKKLLAIILLTATVLAMSSCALIRKTTSDQTPKETNRTDADSETYATDFSDTIPEETSAEPVKYTEDDAFELLTNSFSEREDSEYVKIESTGNIIAQNDGTEYFIFNVALPKPAETSEKPETDENGNEVSETKEIEMEPAVPYYVSVNGVVVTKIADDNIDTSYVKDSFYKKHGETDSETGAKYALEYRGIMKTNDKLCYNFAVFTETAGGAENRIYQYNYLVTVDGGYSAETKLES